MKLKCAHSIPCKWNDLHLVRAPCRHAEHTCMYCQKSIKYRQWFSLSCELCKFKCYSTIRFSTIVSMVIDYYPMDMETTLVPKDEGKKLDQLLKSVLSPLGPIAIVRIVRSKNPRLLARHRVSFHAWTKPRSLLRSWVNDRQSNCLCRNSQKMVLTTKMLPPRLPPRLVEWLLSILYRVVDPLAIQRFHCGPLGWRCIVSRRMSISLTDRWKSLEFAHGNTWAKWNGPVPEYA
mmetsp:Transcript_36459/g.75871  ORF Transcript_36459/g.75871 Transcript_36459/m.75871 type:complete len:233 (+) Transcript_36459:945-1643(+)